MESCQLRNNGLAADAVLPSRSRQPPQQQRGARAGTGSTYPATRPTSRGGQAQARLSPRPERRSPLDWWRRCSCQLPAALAPALTIKPPGRQHTAKKSTRTRRGILWCRSVRQCRPPVASVALGAACVGRPRVPHFLFDARVDAGIDSRIAPVIVILAKACLGKICCKTGAKRRQRAHPRTQRGDPAARRPSARRALAPRERGGSGRNRRGV
jgi:hypothetical protein